MYKPRKASKTTLLINQGYIGETIEQKVRRITVNKEPITDGAPLVYTERSKGVEPQYNIRTDRWEIANEAMGAVTKTHQAKRSNKPTGIGEQAKEGMAKEAGTATAGRTGDPSQ